MKQIPIELRRTFSKPIPNLFNSARAHATITMPRRERRERLAQQPVPPSMVQDPPYYRQGFQYGLSMEHHLGAVNGLPLDYGIDTRKPWGKQTDLARVVVKKSNLEDAGYGLFAKQFIPANTLFAKYYGVVISEKKAMQLLLQVSHY
jgi:hypothetical protein